MIDFKLPIKMVHLEAQAKIFYLWIFKTLKTKKPYQEWSLMDFKLPIKNGPSWSPSKNSFFWWIFKTLRRRKNLSGPVIDRFQTAHKRKKTMREKERQNIVRTCKKYVANEQRVFCLHNNCWCCQEICKAQFWTSPVHTAAGNKAPAEKKWFFWCLGLNIFRKNQANIFLDALASLAFKLRVSEWVSD